MCTRRTGTPLGPSLAAVFLITLLVLTARPAAAFPQFGRKYNLPCARCHTMIQRLTPFGYAFFRAGFRMPTSPKKPVTLGNTMSALTQLNIQTNRGGQPAFDLPGVDVVLATPLEKHTSLLAWYTSALSNSESSGFNDLWLQFNSGAKGSFWSLRVGQLPVLDGYQLLGDRIVTITDASLFGPNGPLSGAGQGNFAIAGLERGAQLGYTNGGLSTRISLLEGVDETGAGNVPPQGNRYNDYVVQSDYLIGKEGSALGGFYYNGRTPLLSMNYTNSFQRAGLFGTYSRFLIPGKPGIPYLQGELNVGLLWGQDTVSAAGQHADSYGTLYEADLYFQHRTALAARYDSARPSGMIGTPNTEAYTFALSQRPNDRLMLQLEYRRQRQPNTDSLITSIHFYY